MQRLIEKETPLLDKEGRVTPGYSTKEILKYNRENIKANKFRIKEWDFYQIEDITGRYVIQMTFGHASYIGTVGVMMFDTTEKRMLVNKQHITILPMDRMKLPKVGQKNSHIHWENFKKTILVDFDTKDGVRTLTFSRDDFQAHFVLTPQIKDGLVISIPFDEKPTQFYYNQKYSAMKAVGVVTYTDKDSKNRVTLSFHEKKEDMVAYGLLDWGRGVWPYSTEWLWSNGTGTVDDKIFGFNLGCGFGNTSNATENIIYYEGKTHKLDQVVISHEEDYMKPWMIRDNEGRLDLKMIPDYDRTTVDKFLFVNNCCHQVFGRFEGTVVLDDKRVLQVHDVFAFAEHAKNHW